MLPTNLRTHIIALRSRLLLKIAARNLLPSSRLPVYHQIRHIEINTCKTFGIWGFGQFRTGRIEHASEEDTTEDDTVSIFRNTLKFLKNGQYRDRRQRMSQPADVSVRQKCQGFTSRRHCSRDTENSPFVSYFPWCGTTGLRRCSAFSRTLPRIAPCTLFMFARSPYLSAWSVRQGYLACEKAILIFHARGGRVLYFNLYCRGWRGKKIISVIANIIYHPMFKTFGFLPWDGNQTRCSLEFSMGIIPDRRDARHLSDLQVL